MDETWEVPIILKCDATGELITLKEPREALAFLTGRWPRTSGAAYDRALQSCSNAMADPHFVDDARRAVIAAVTRAGYPNTDDAIRIPCKSDPDAHR